MLDRTTNCVSTDQNFWNDLRIRKKHIIFFYTSYFGLQRLSSKIYNLFINFNDMSYQTTDLPLWVDSA